MGDSLESCTLVRLEVGWPQTLWLLFVISLPFWGTTPGTPIRRFLEPDPKINHPSYSTSLLDFCELMVSGLPCLNTFRLAGPPLPNLQALTPARLMLPRQFFGVALRTGSPGKLGRMKKFQTPRFSNFKREQRGCHIRTTSGPIRYADLAVVGTGSSVIASNNWKSCRHMDWSENRMALSLMVYQNVHKMIHIYIYSIYIYTYIIVYMYIYCICICF